MRIIGATLGYNMHPQLAWERVFRHRWWIFRWKTKKILVMPYEWELDRYRQYYPDGRYTWPKDPKSGEKLPIATS